MIDRILRSRALVVFVSFVLVGLSGLGVKNLDFDPNNRVFFGPGHHHYQNLLDVEASFGSNTNLFFVVAGNSSILDHPDLEQAVRWLSENVWRIQQVVAVDSVAGFPLVLDDDDELVVHNLLDFVCPRVTGACIEGRLHEFQKPHVVNRLVDQKAQAFSVVAKVDLFDPLPGEVVFIASSANSLAREVEERFGTVSVYLTGGVPMMNAFLDAAQSDSETLLGFVVVILAIGLLLFLGGGAPTILMVLLGSASIIVSMGVAGWLGLTINTATATVPLIVFTLVVASAMHVFLHLVREERLDSSGAVTRAARAAVVSNVRPVILTALTTVVGLLSMSFVSAPPLRQLGFLSAIGVATGAVLSLTLIPCLFSYLSRLRRSLLLVWVQEVMNAYAKWLERRRPRMMLVFLFFLVVLAGVFRIVIDEDFVRYFSSETSFRSDTESIGRLMAGPYHIDVIYDSGESAGIYNPQSMADLKRIISWLRDHPDVVNVLSIVDIIEEVSLVLSGDTDLANKTPEDLAQYFLSYELSLNIGQSTMDLIDTDHRASRVSVLLADVSMAEIRDLVESINLWAADNVAHGSIVVSGEGVPTAYLSSESIKEMVTGIAVSIALSVLLIGIYFRSWRASLSIFAATAVPILAGFGAWGWFESEIGMAATLVVAITLGVVIDDTIHLTYRYVDSLRNLDLDPWGATAYSVHKTGTAIFVTSVVLVTGLLVLMASDFRMNSTFGICSSFIIGLALIYNLAIAPRFLNRLR